MSVYALSHKGTLHKVIRSEGGLLSLEADNLDDTTLTLYGRIFDVPEAKLKRFCTRCFPGGRADG